jgi:ABC-type glycerol-3-phosphate transport system substrate-binding protein
LVPALPRAAGGAPVGSGRVVRKITAFVLPLVLVLGLAPAFPQARPTLKMIWVGWPEAHIVPLVQAAAADASVEVDLERIPFGRLFETLDIRLGARTSTPDVYAVDGPMTASYAVRGHLLPLDDVFTADEKRDWLQACIDQGTFDRKLYSAPVVTSSQLLYYNKTLFQRAGIPFPPADVRQRWTWEQVVEAARKIARPSEGIWGIVLEQTDRPYQILPLAQSKGAAGISPDGLRASGYIDSPAFVEAMTFYQRLFTEWQVSPKGLFEIPQVTELFGTGKLAMLVGELWNLRFLEAYKGLSWGVAPHPYFQGGKVVTPTGSWHIGINPRTERRREAIAFVKAFVSSKENAMLFDLTRRTPCRRSVYRQKAGEFSLAPWRIVLYELANTAVPRPLTPGFREYENILQQALRDIQLGADVKRTLQAAAARIDRELAKYRQ